MLQKVPETKSCPSWTPEEIQELRSSLRTSDIAAVDTEMFGKKFSEIIGRVRHSKKRSRANRMASAADLNHGSLNSRFGPESLLADSRVPLLHPSQAVHHPMPEPSNDQPHFC
jgi:hypothetical protein